MSGCSIVPGLGAKASTLSLPSSIDQGTADSRYYNPLDHTAKSSEQRRSPQLSKDVRRWLPRHLDVTANVIRATDPPHVETIPHHVEDDGAVESEPRPGGYMRDAATGVFGPESLESGSPALVNDTHSVAFSFSLSFLVIIPLLPAKLRKLATQHYFIL